MRGSLLHLADQLLVHYVAAHRRMSSCLDSQEHLVAITLQPINLQRCIFLVKGAPKVRKEGGQTVAHQLALLLCFILSEQCY